MSVDGNTVVIAGSGVAGSALASVLAQEGRDVTVIERSMVPPERLNGELLHAGGIDALEELGLGGCLAGLDKQIATGFVMVDRATDFELHVPFSKDHKAYSMNNGSLIDALRKKAQEEKRCTYIVASVEDVIEEDGVIKGVTYRRKNSNKQEELRSNLTFLCDGSYSRLRKRISDDKPVKYGTLVTFKYPASPENFGTDEDPEFHIPLFMSSNCSNFSYHVDSREGRIVTNVRAECEWPGDLKKYVKDQLSSVPEEFSGPMLAHVDDADLSCVHTFQANCIGEFHPGVIALGDAMSQRHPITGAGMTIIMKDIVIWRDLLRQVPNLKDVDAMRAGYTQFLVKRKEYTYVMNLNAKLFHEVCYPANEHTRFERTCMMRYMRWSPKARRELAAIWSQKDNRPWVYIYHLAMSTLFTAGCVVQKRGWWALPLGLIDGAWSLYSSTVDLVNMCWDEYKRRG